MDAAPPSPCSGAQPCRQHQAFLPRPTAATASTPLCHRSTYEIIVPTNPEPSIGNVMDRVTPVRVLFCDGPISFPADANISETLSTVLSLLSCSLRSMLEHCNTPLKQSVFPSLTPTSSLFPCCPAFLIPPHPPLCPLLEGRSQPFISARRPRGRPMMISRPNLPCASGFAFSFFSDLDIALICSPASSSLGDLAPCLSVRHV